MVTLYTHIKVDGSFHTCGKCERCKAGEKCLSPVTHKMKRESVQDVHKNGRWRKAHLMSCSGCGHFEVWVK